MSGDSQKEEVGIQNCVKIVEEEHAVCTKGYGQAVPEIVELAGYFLVR